MTAKMRWKSAGIAAALLLSASSVAMAATATVTKRTLALEALDGTITQVIPGGAGTQNGILLTPATTFGNAQVKITYNLTGAKFSAAVPTTAITGAGCTGLAANAISTGGAVGDSSVAFLVDPSGCTTIIFTPAKFNNFSTSGVTVSSITLTLANSATLVDNGVTGYASGNQTYIAVVDANTGSTGPANSSQIDLGAANKLLIAAFDTNTTTNFLTARMLDTLVPALDQDLLATFGVGFPATTSGTLTFTNVPAAVDSVVLKRSATYTGSTLTLFGAAGTVIPCTAFAAGPPVKTVTCPIPLADLNALAAGEKMLANFHVDGVTPLDNASVNAKLDVTYPAGYQPTVDTKFGPSTVAIVNFGACVADFGSVVGANPYGIISTLRIANRSGIAAQTYTSITKEDGTSTAAIAFTQANTGVNAGLNAGNLLPAGGTLEVRGTTLETISGLSFTLPDGRSRARVRLFVQTSQTAGGSAGSLGVSGSVPAGCSAEGFLCTSNAACSLMEQMSDGKDGKAIAAPSK